MHRSMGVNGLNYYSATWDCVAWPAEEEGDMRIVASFPSRDTARTFALSDAGKREVVYVRPPSATFRDALDIVRYLLAVHEGEGTTEPTPLRAY